MSLKLNSSKLFLYFASVQLFFLCANVVGTKKINPIKKAHKKNYPHTVFVLEKMDRWTWRSVISRFRDEKGL